MQRGAVIIGLFLSLLINLNAVVFAANIEGNVKDAVTGEGLYGANIILVGTGLGAASDIDGNYKIQGVKPGKYTIRVSYIGYKTPEFQIEIKDNKTFIQNFNLDPVGLEGETVVVTAQAVGQKQAINQQLTSDQIVNVVSAAKIKELPDANAAESVGRLPGVSILRSGGEGYGVVIRGLAPKYNSVMVDGIQMSSTNGSDRSTNLSMITSDMLEGIQVSKTVTADMDAAVLGGTVNFELREAKSSGSNIPSLNFEIGGAYNALSNVHNQFNNYKYLFSAENRFLEDKLGVFAQVDVERKNLSSNNMGASYSHLGRSTTAYETNDINLSESPTDRQRYNGALVVDYKLPAGKIKFTNLFSTGETDGIGRSEVFNIGSNSKNYNLSHYNSNLTIITNGIDLQQDVSFFNVRAKVSHTYSEAKTPKSWTASFLQTSAGINQYSGVDALNPLDIAKSGSHDLSNAYLNTYSHSSDFSRERAITASLDLKTTLNISELITADVKFGGKYRYQKRSYDYTSYSGTLAGGAGKIPNEMLMNHFGFPQTNNVMMNYFIDPNYDLGEMFDGDYKMLAALNYGMLSEVTDFLFSNVDYFRENGSTGGFGYDYRSSIIDDYYGHENQSAFYVMSVINVGPQLTIIPGVRYQNLETTYNGIRGINTTATDSYLHYDTTVTQSHGYWLPDISLRYKPFTWFDIRLSYSNTLSYPDYGTIIPKISLAGTSISYGNYSLKPSRSANYDVYLSFYDNTIGLFTVGGFYKQITDLIYYWNFHASNKDAIPYFPHQLMESYPNGNYSIGTFVNNQYKIDNYGMELDWQTHFWYLPGPLSGLVFSANYTHIFSEAEYPYTDTRQVGRGQIVYVDTSYNDRLLYQPDDIVNLSLGFDYKDFSIRVSMLYQTDIFTGPDYWPQTRSHTSAYRRWDISAKQDLPWYNIQVYGNINNLNDAYDQSVIAAGGTPTSQQEYGMLLDFGIRVKL